MPDPEYIVQWNFRGLTTKVGELREHLRLGKHRAWAFLLQETNGSPRCGSITPLPGKAAIYGHMVYSRTPIPLEAWCTAWQGAVKCGKGATAQMRNNACIVLCVATQRACTQGTIGLANISAPL